MTDETLAAILSAAESLFVRGNYADVSMRDIARAAKVTTGALYYHFPSKEKLYLAMLTAGLARVGRLMAEAVPAQAACRQKLRSLTGVFLSLPPERRRLMRLVRRDINVFRGRGRRAIVQAYQQALPELVEAILREGLAADELRPQDPRWLAWVYIAIAETSLAPYAEARLGPLDARLDSLLDQFLVGAGRAA